MTKTVRVELPVLLYVDIEFTVQDERERPSWGAAKQRIWDLLGEPGEERGISICRIADGTKDCGVGGLAHARIYPSDHTFCDSDERFFVIGSDGGSAEIGREDVPGFCLACGTQCDDEGICPNEANHVPC